MSAPDVFGRLLEVLLPKGGTVVVFEAYFDESGGLDTSPPIACVSGYVLTLEGAKLLDGKWRHVLDEHRIPYFHMVDCAHGNGVFSGKSKEERSEIVRKLIALIKTYTSEGFSSVLNHETFPCRDDHAAYSWGAERVIAALSGFLVTVRGEKKISCFFESGHHAKSRSYAAIASRLKDMGASITFAGKQDARLLQAADLLAWQTTKYAKDQLSGAREPRKDFLSLMEHPHTFLYTTLKNGGLNFGVQLWPISDGDGLPEASLRPFRGPPRMVQAEGEQIPLIFVNRPIRCRRMNWGLSIEMEDMGGEEFGVVLGDERRLIELFTFLGEVARSVASEGAKVALRNIMRKLASRLDEGDEPMA